MWDRTKVVVVLYVVDPLGQYYRYLQKTFVASRLPAWVPLSFSNRDAEIQERQYGNTTGICEVEKDGSIPRD
jgi:hypothetical protein